VPSASRHTIRLALLAVCGSLLLGAGSGCSTTQEKAAQAKARADHILEARAERQKARKHEKNAKGKSNE
jgi:hypothetical protein